MDGLKRMGAGDGGVGGGVWWSTVKISETLSCLLPSPRVGLIRLPNKRVRSLKRKIVFRCIAVKESFNVPGFLLLSV